MARRAPLVGTATCADPEIPDLRGPHKDVAALAALPAAIGESADAYQAPEQRDSPELVGPRTDVDRLAAIGYDPLTGRRPTSALAPPSELNSNPNAHLDRVRLHALGPYEGGPADGAEFAAALAAVR